MLREPCVHGRYERHLLISPERTDVCDPRFLTDAEALSLLLTEECEECGGSGVVASPIRPHKEYPCPSCGGSGRTPREGVHMSEPDGVWLMVPASMLEGGE